MKKRIFILIALLMVLSACQREGGQGLMTLIEFEKNYMANDDLVVTYDIFPDSYRTQVVYICDPDRQIGALDIGNGQVHYYEDGKWWHQSEDYGRKESNRGDFWPGRVLIGEDPIGFRQGLSHMKSLSFSLLEKVGEQGLKARGFREGHEGSEKPKGLSQGFEDVKDGLFSQIAQVGQEGSRETSYKTGLMWMKESMWGNLYSIPVNELKNRCGPIREEVIGGDPDRLILRADRDMEYVGFSDPEEDLWDGIEVKLNVREGILEHAKWFYEGQVVQEWKLVANPESDPLSYQQILIEKYALEE